MSIYTKNTLKKYFWKMAHILAKISILSFDGFLKNRIFVILEVIIDWCQYFNMGFSIFPGY